MNAILVETRTICLKWWKPGQYAQNGGNQDNKLKMVETSTIQSDLNFDVIPPLVVVFLQFKICMRFQRHMYKDMVLLSPVAFVAIEQ